MQQKYKPARGIVTNSNWYIRIFVYSVYFPEENMHQLNKINRLVTLKIPQFPVVIKVMYY